MSNIIPLPICVRKGIKKLLNKKLVERIPAIPIKIHCNVVNGNTQRI